MGIASCRARSRPHALTMHRRPPSASYSHLPATLDMGSAIGVAGIGIAKLECMVSCQHPPLNEPPSDTADRVGVP